MRRLMWLAIVAMVVAACSTESGDGGDGGDENTGEAPATTSQATQPASSDDDSEERASDTTAPPADDDGGGEGPSTASVTINGETYRFSSEGALVAQCLPDLFGIMSVQLPMVDDDGQTADGSIQIIALHEDTDPEVVEQTNKVQITIGDVDWVADPEDVRIVDNAEVEGQSQVDSLEVSGSTVTGSASFAGSSTVFTSEFVEFATGTFEATCGEERTS